MKDRRNIIWTFALISIIVTLLCPPVYALSWKAAKKFVSLNGRLGPSQQSDPFPIPSNKILVITDIVIQNRASGDSPVDPSEFSRLFLSGDPDDFVLTVVGNDTISLHFTTGIRVMGGTFRILNAVNSSAPSIEYLINGFFVRIG